MTRQLTRLTLILGVPYLVILALIVFWPTPVDAGMKDDLDRIIARLARHRLGFIDYAFIEASANVVLFIPFGLLLALHVRAPWAWLAVFLGAITSTAIETIQLLLLSARYASGQDIVMNTTGAAIGAVMGALLRQLVVSQQRRRASDWDLAYTHIPLRGTAGVVGDQP
ncbi:VanZ family protein [Rathayibacter toxicus]|uniref:VanZ family protein n=1 Tax=Rathayibacter toxicus TaxID=145458 RepID=A0A2S5Y558_9MICO|nr:VanZ family protein [Rathayibacter toxicus]ALS57659.1 hypothetical protein APU90_07665 [Rathayibacter toxicus]PPG20669.1 VanZ family protein [Rathayibacter toxicus]PPG45773.1 VanZ family protein [Rathayibacter toxicus]PPH21717.1 VanZ family protein [Rathayibacter toxicus]PPH56146.1 VanZ family protein [Rathayibacter toxicus]